MRHRTDAVDVVREFGGWLRVSPSRRDAKGCADFEERTSSDVEVTHAIAARLPISFGEIENNACGSALKLISEVSIEASDFAKRKNKFFRDEVSNIKSVKRGGSFVCGHAPPSESGMPTPANSEGIETVLAGRFRPRA